MTTSEMADRIVDCVKLNGSTSFVEIMQALGDEAKGKGIIEILPNVILWGGVSQQFSDALRETNGRIVPIPTSFLVYLHDGAVMRYPIAKKITRNGYKELHWLPVVFNVRKAQ